jgi:hypothetical protein
MRPIPKGTAKMGILPQCHHCCSSLTLATHLHRPAASTCVGLFIYHWVNLLSSDNVVMGQNPENSLLQKNAGKSCLQKTQSDWMLPRTLRAQVAATCTGLPFCGGTIRWLISAVTTTVLCTAHTTNSIYSQHI